MREYIIGRGGGHGCIGGVYVWIQIEHSPPHKMMELGLRASLLDIST
jgi:hypothetical protein